MSKAKFNEEVRNAVLDYLGARPSVSQTADTIFRRLKTEYPELTLADINAALIFLENQKFVEFNFDKLGSTKYWKSTSEGVLYVERKYNL